jgi:hypothetical protein
VASHDTDAAAAVHDSGLSGAPLPPLLDAQLALTSAAARLCATMIAAVPEEVGARAAARGGGRVWSGGGRVAWLHPQSALPCRTIHVGCCSCVPAQEEEESVSELLKAVPLRGGLDLVDARGSAAAHTISPGADHSLEPSWQRCLAALAAATDANPPTGACPCRPVCARTVLSAVRCPTAVLPACVCACSPCWWLCCWLPAVQSGRCPC